MPTTFDECGDDVADALHQLLTTKDAFRELHVAGVTFDLLFASNPDGAAIKRNGYPCAAKVRIVPLKDRAKGQADVEIVIDERSWNDRTRAKQQALLAHELMHLVVLRQKDEATGLSTGPVKTDDKGRPRLKCRPHDFEVGLFKDMVIDYGLDAPEAESLAAVFEASKTWVQGVFPWG